MVELRVGINLSNSILVTGRSSAGSPTGPAPEFASRMAAELGMTPRWVEYPRPTAVAEAAARDEWDICLIAADPAREEHIVFTQPWFPLQVCYAAPSSSPLKTNTDVDQANVRVVSVAGSAYTLWLERNLAKAELVFSQNFGESQAAVAEGRADVLAGLRTPIAALESDLHPLAENFMTVDQSIGIRRAADSEFIATITDVVGKLVQQ